MEPTKASLKCKHLALRGLLDLHKCPKCKQLFECVVSEVVGCSQYKVPHYRTRVVPVHLPMPRYPGLRMVIGTDVYVGEPLRYALRQQLPQAAVGTTCAEVVTR